MPTYIARPHSGLHPCALAIRPAVVELTTMPALTRSRASTGGDVSNVVAITDAIAAFFMTLSFHTDKRAGGTNGCHEPCGREPDLILYCRNKLAHRSTFESML